MDTTGDIRMSDLMSPTAQAEGINPTSKDWHLQMKALNQQTKQLEGMSSHVVTVLCTCKGKGLFLSTCKGKGLGRTGEVDKERSRI